MFPEYQEQAELLRASDKNFSRLCDKHSALDAEIQELEHRKSPSLQLDIERLKKQKLAAKQEAYTLLQNALPELELKMQKNYVDLNTLAQMSGVRLQA